MLNAQPDLFGSLPEDVFHLFEGGELRSQRVVELLDLKKEEIATATKVPRNSVRYDHKIPAELLERLTEWAIAINLVGSHFKDLDKTMLWFQVENPLLGGVSPRAMIRAGRAKKLISFIRTALTEGQR